MGDYSLTSRQRSVLQSPKPTRPYWRSATLTVCSLTDAMHRIFLSYRRSDSQDVTGRIYDRLLTQFGPDTIFKDVDAIPVGGDFTQHLTDAVGQCQVLLAV